jgi:ribosomal-protein-alanine N-acetyltransferase
MEPPPLVRPGDAGDIGVVEALMEDAFDPCFGEAWTRGQCLGVLAMPGVHLLLVWEDAGDGGRPLGFALSRLVLDEAELLLLAVARVARGRGVGGALLAAAAGDMRARGAASMHLEVRADNPAVRLYAAHGFSKQGERRAYYRGRDGRARDAWTFKRLLNRTV